MGDSRGIGREPLGFGFQQGVNRDLRVRKKIIGVRKGAQGTLVGNHVGTEMERPINDELSAFHELFQGGTGRATGRRMAMRTI